MSYCGYDISIAQDLHVPSNGFVLGSSIEKFNLPNNIMGMQHDKSTWARQGVVVQNTVLEPGWRGYLTIELSNHGDKDVTILRGTPIAQITFHFLDQDSSGYKGKYQDQASYPQIARLN
jgi:dCTP deaminase